MGQHGYINPCILIEITRSIDQMVLGQRKLQLLNYPFGLLKRANGYAEWVIGNVMVEIECPHCDEDIELDDGVYGLFDCPLCGEEFEWDSPSIWTADNFVK